MREVTAKKNESDLNRYVREKLEFPVYVRPYIGSYTYQ